MNGINAPEVSAVEVADQFGRTSKRLGRAFDDALARHGATTPRARVLLEVAARGPSRLTVIAAAVGIAQGTASEMADALVREGLLARREDPSDRRAILLETTSLGLAQSERWRGAYEQAAGDLFQPLSPAQRAQLMRLLEALEPS